MSGEWTGYEDRVGKAIDVPRGWVGLPWDKNPVTAEDSDFIPVLPGTYVIDRVESFGGQPWIFIAAGSQRYSLDAVDALGPPERAAAVDRAGADPAADLERLKAVNFLVRLKVGLPWDVDPEQAKKEDWVVVQDGTYRVDRVEMRGDERWVWLYESPYYRRETSLPNVKLRAWPGEFEPPMD